MDPVFAGNGADRAEWSGPSVAVPVRLADNLVDAVPLGPTCGDALGGVAHGGIGRAEPSSGADEGGLAAIGHGEEATQVFAAVMDSIFCV